MDYKQELKSIRQSVESNEKGILLISQAIIDLSIELTKNSEENPKEQAVEIITAQLEEYIQVRCSSCSIRERLEKLEQEGE
jgi:hypothetical protein